VTPLVAQPSFRRHTNEQTNRWAAASRKALALRWRGLSNGATVKEALLQQAVWPPGSADTVRRRPPPTLTFDRLTLKLVRVASTADNLPSKFEHAMPLHSGIIRNVRDGLTDRRTYKSNAYCPLPYRRGHNKPNEVEGD